MDVYCEELNIQRKGNLSEVFQHWKKEKKMRDMIIMQTTQQEWRIVTEVTVYNQQATNQHLMKQLPKDMEYVLKLYINLNTRKVLLVHQIGFGL